MMSVSQLLAGMARQRGNADATVFGTRRRSWSQWLHDVQCLAGGLRAIGLESGDRVAILAFNSDRYLDALFATAWAGGVVVPVNTRLHPTEIAFILRHAGARFAFVGAEMAEVAERALAQSEHSIPIIDLEADAGAMNVAALIAGNGPVEDAGRHDDDLSGIFYTGGTTGTPKGVMLGHAGHVVHSLALWCGVVSDLAGIRYLHAAPMFHAADMEFVYGVTAAGGAHYALPRFDPAEFIAAVERWGITDAVLVPTMIQMVMEHPSFAPKRMKSLTRLWYGGAPTPLPVIQRIAAELPGCELIQLYGQTESGPIITRLEGRDHRADNPQRLRSAGRAVPGCEVRILGPNATSLPAGEIGEIAVRSGTTMLGYWNEPAQTAEALSGGWLHTGDAGYLDEDGYLFITDRFKDMIISGGENVYSIEVEQAIMACDGIRQCAVIGLPDPRWGERVHAIVVPHEDQGIDIPAIQARLKQRLAAYKIPRDIEVRTSPLPLSGAGKILKRVLRDEMLAAMAP